jgi:hypothetical protein
MNNILLSTEIDKWHHFDPDKACGLLATLVHWTSRHISLPTIYWNMFRTSIESDIHPLMKCSGYAQTLKVNLDMLRVCLHDILAHPSTFETPLASMAPWETDKIVRLSITIAYAAMGCLTS